MRSTFWCIRSRSSTAWSNFRIVRWSRNWAHRTCAPIAHCLGWPDRIVGPAARLDLAKIGQLTFEAPDFDRFPALRLAYDALRTGRGATTVYNAANEVAVAAFIAGKIKFGAIARLVEATMEAWIRSGNLAPLTSADDAIAIDHNARNKAATLLPQIALKAS